MKKLISLVIPARNDNYMGNSNWRLETTLNFNAKQFYKLGRLDELEQIVVDWGSREPLFNVLNLSKETKRTVRFILVPNQIAEKANKDSDFADVIALNVGVRRAFGEYIVQTGADVLWPEEFLKPLFDILDGKKMISKPADKTIMIFSRKHVPWEIVSQNLSTEDIEQYLSKESKNLKVDPLIFYFLAPGGSVMMHRKLWLECRGYNEKLLYWGWNDVDLSLRIRLRYNYIDMGEKYGMHVYHLEHYAKREGISKEELPLRAKKQNPHVFGPFLENNDDWGLGTYRFEENPSGNYEAAPLEYNNIKEFNRFYRKKHLLNILRFVFTQWNRNEAIANWYLLKEFFTSVLNDNHEGIKVK